MIKFLGDTCEEQLEYAMKMVARYKYDEMTTLKRRIDFDEAFERIIDSRIYDKRSFTFALVDINNLKMTNDKYGYLAGDELIKDVAKNLKDQFEDQATVYRIGGDEFAILYNTLNREDAKKILDDSNIDENYCFGIADSNEFDWNITKCRDVFIFVNNILIDAKAEKNSRLKKRNKK